MTHQKQKKIEELVKISKKGNPELNHRHITHSNLLNSVTVKDIQEYTEKICGLFLIGNKHKTVMISHIAREQGAE